MIIKKSKELAQLDNFRLISGLYLPRPVFLINTLSENGTVNMGPFSYCGFVATNPPLISVSVLRKKDGSKKDTALNLLRTGEAVLHLTDSKNVQDVQTASKTLPYGESELPLLDLTLVDSETVSVPGVKESKIRMEAKVNKYVEVEGNDVFFLEIEAFIIEDESVITEDGRLIMEELDLMSKLYGKDYSTIGEVISVDSKKKV